MITRAQIRRQLRAQGGIMNTVPREGFFLGGVGDFFGDVLGKAGKAVKKVVGSPIGKAALLGLGASVLGPKIMSGGLKGLGGKLFGTALPGAVGRDAFMGMAGKTGTKGILSKLGLTKGFGSKMPTILGAVTGGSLLTYFMGKGASEEEAEDLIKDVYRGEGIGFDQIRADINKYRSGELNQQQMFDKNYRFLVPRGSFRAAEGGRAGYQTGGISMGNTLAQNIAANQAQAGQVQQMLQAARSRLPGAAPAGITSVPTEQAMPQPVKTPPPLNPGTVINPETGLALFSGNTEQTISTPTGLGKMAKRVITNAMPMVAQQTPGAPPRMPGMGGMSQEDFMKLSEAEQMKIMDADVAEQNAELEKYGSFADGRTIDPRAGGRSAYNDLLNVFKFDFPQVQLTGNETLAELDTMANKLYGYKNGGRIGFKNGSKNKTIIPKKKPKFMTEEELEELYPGLARGEIYDYEKKKKAAKKANGGLMEIPTGDMRRNRAGVMERDYRDKGGFVPVGVKEKADDVPAMLSKNEFVMTADAVRGAGDGNINKGAQRMYDLMKQNESKVV